VLQRQKLVYQAAAIAHALFHRQQQFGLLVSDEGGKILEANTVVCQMLQRTENQLQDSGWDQMTHPEDLEIDRQLVMDTIAQKIKGYRLLKRYLLPNQEPIPVGITVLRINGVFDIARYLVIVEHWEKPFTRASVLWIER
jgi:PAS domain-containing protein